jgi:hypothetical protein
LLLNAYVHDGITLNGDEQHLVGLANRIRLFAPPNVIDEADAVIRGLIEISLKPSLLPFSLARRADLDNVYRTIH